MKYILFYNKCFLQKVSYKVSYYWRKHLLLLFENNQLTDLIHKHSRAQSAFPWLVCRSRFLYWIICSWFVIYHTISGLNSSDTERSDTGLSYAKLEWSTEREEGNHDLSVINLCLSISVYSLDLISAVILYA